MFRKVTKKSDSGYKVTIYDVREGAFKEAFERLRSNIQEKGIEPLMIPWDRLEAIKTCDNRTPHAENCSFVYCFLALIFFKYSHCNRNKIRYLKTIDYDHYVASRSNPLKAKG